MGGLTTSGGPDLDAWLEKLRQCDFLAEDELKVLCEYVRTANQAQAHATCDTMCVASTGWWPCCRSLKFWWRSRMSSQ